MIQVRPAVSLALASLLASLLAACGSSSSGTPAPVGLVTPAPISSPGASTVDGPVDLPASGGTQEPTNNLDANPTPVTHPGPVAEAEPTVPGTQVPVSSTVESSGAINFLQLTISLIGEATDPSELGDALLATSETDEPDPRI